MPKCPLLLTVLLLIQLVASVSVNILSWNVNEIVLDTFLNFIPGLGTGLTTGDKFVYFFSVPSYTFTPDAVQSWKVGMLFDPQAIIDNGTGVAIGSNESNVDSISLTFRPTLDGECIMSMFDYCEVAEVIWSTFRISGLPADNYYGYISMPSIPIIMPPLFQNEGDIYIVMTVADAGQRRMIPPALTLQMELTPEYVETITYQGAVTFQQMLLDGDLIELIAYGEPSWTTAWNFQHTGTFYQFNDKAMIFPFRGAMTGGSDAPFTPGALLRIEIRLVDISPSMAMTLPVSLAVLSATTDESADCIFPQRARQCSCRTTGLIRRVNNSHFSIDGYFACNASIELLPYLLMKPISNENNHLLSTVNSSFPPLTVVAATNADIIVQQFDFVPVTSTTTTTTLLTTTSASATSLSPSVTTTTSPPPTTTTTSVQTPSTSPSAAVRNPPFNASDHRVEELGGSALRIGFYSALGGAAALVIATICIVWRAMA